MDKIALDIKANIIFEKHDEIPVDYAIKAIMCINDTFFFSELEDLRALKQEFPDIPKVAYDAAEHRMQRHKRQCVLLTGINKGSVEIELIGVGLALWVLKQTIGETIKEAWRETEMNRRIKQFLLHRLAEKHQALVTNSERRLKRSIPGSVRVRSIDTPERFQISIQIWLLPKDEEPFPRNGRQNLK